MSCALRRGSWDSRSAGGGVVEPALAIAGVGGGRGAAFDHDRQLIALERDVTVPSSGLK